MAIGTALGIAAMAVSGASAVSSYSQSRKASKARRAQNETQRKINRLRNKQAKRQFLRNFRQAQAASIMGAVGAGVGIESSRAQGALSSQRTQAQLAVTEFNTFDDLGDTMTMYMNRESNASARAAGWGALSQFAQQFASFSTPGGGGEVEAPGKINPPT